MNRVRPAQHRPPPSRRARSRGRGGDRASATVEVAVLLPLVMLLLMAVVQAGIYFHSVAVATTAARKAVAAASVDGGGPAQGEVAGTQFLDQNGASLTNRHVVVATDGSNARVRVTGDVASLMFGVPFSVTVVVDAPIEQVSP